jgi:hypothetical protein
MGFGNVNDIERRLLPQVIINLLQVTDLPAKWWSGVATENKHERLVAIGSKVDRVVRIELDQFDRGHGIANVQIVLAAVGSNGRQCRLPSPRVSLAANVLKVAFVDPFMFAHVIDICHRFLSKTLGIEQQEVIRLTGQVPARCRKAALGFGRTDSIETSSVASAELVSFTDSPVLNPLCSFTQVDRTVKVT